MIIREYAYPVYTSQVKNVGDKVRFWGHVGRYLNHAILDPVNGQYRGRVTLIYDNGDIDVTDTNGHQWRVKTNI